MNALILEETDNTPKIVLDPEGDNYEITGESRPEDVRKFYEPVVNWLSDFNTELESQGARSLQFKFNFEYFNSSSAKYVMDIMEQLSEIHENSSNQADVTIHWHYDELDEDMQEAGEEFENMVEIPFEFHPYS